MRPRQSDAESRVRGGTPVRDLCRTLFDQAAWPPELFRRPQL